MIYTLLTIYNQNQPPENDTLFPIFDENWTLKLGTDEEIVWEGKANDVEFASKGIKGWKVKDADVTITNQRIVYVCKKYKKAGVWFGGGLAILFWLIDALWTAYSRRGKAAVGQIRHQWPRVIMSSTSKHQDMLRSSNDFSIMVADADQRNYMVRFRMPLEMRDKAASVLVGYIAQLRVTRDFDPKKFPNDDLKKVEETQVRMLERLTKKVKTEEKQFANVDYYEVSKTSLPVPQLV